jgi:GH15 family glucan-1,4-alpha-glucosidase
MCERAVEFLKKYLDDIFENKNTFKPSYDLWEEHEGTTFYSVSAIYSAMKVMLEIDKKVKSSFEDNFAKIDTIQKRDEALKIYIDKIKLFAENIFFDEYKQSFVRNTDDRKIDISLLGAVVPFGMIDPKDERFLGTVEKINTNLRTYTGGYIRYENDGYMGGCNPWPIATLWMALYYLEIGDIEQAKSCFDFVVRSSTEHGFLAEQVNNNKMESMWVIGLAWSHAMFLIVLEKLMKINLGL